jgi:dienelactone hydrolase
MSDAPPDAPALLSALERRYATRARAFAAPKGSESRAWERWRADIRSRLLDRLGIEPFAGSDAHFETLDETRLADHRRLLMAVASPAGDEMRVWLLVPSGSTAPRAAVVAVHGHGSGVNEIVGLRPDGTPRTDSAGYQHDFALSLVRSGFIVAAPELLGFGSRRTDADALGGDEANSCRTLATWALMLGTTVIGQRVVDLRLTVDLLQQRDDVDHASIGVFGMSGGATSSLFAAAIDERLRAVALSGYVSSFRASVLSMDHCICNLIPGLLADAEMGDIALALSPRPLLLEAGRDDPIFPVTAALAAADRIRSGYVAQGHGDRFELDVFAGGHEISGRRAFDFLVHWLGRDVRAAPDRGSA